MEIPAKANLEYGSDLLCGCAADGELLLLTKDGLVMKVPQKCFDRSTLIKTILQNHDNVAPSEPVPVPKVTAHTLRLILQWLQQMETHAPTAVPKPLLMPLCDYVTPFEWQFLTRHCLEEGDEKKHLNLILVLNGADFLGIAQLRDLTTAMLAHMLMGKDVDQLHALFASELNGRHLGGEDVCLPTNTPRLFQEELVALRVAYLALNQIPSGGNPPDYFVPYNYVLEKLLDFLPAKRPVQSLLKKIEQAEVSFSTHASSGDGGHATYFYASPGAETAGAEHVRHAVLQEAHKRLRVSFPRNTIELEAFVDGLKGFLSTTVFNDQQAFSGVADPSTWVSGGHYRAPTTAAIAAMRNRIDSILCGQQLDMLLLRVQQ